MLKRLSIKNIALIDSADIEFNCGLNVLSGETGSGKSVILDSINFVLGSKADRSLIRYGESEALVKAEFEVANDSEVIQILNDFDIEADNCVIISRKYNIEGKGAIKINGESVTASMLKTISQHLVDVHGQSEHFFLLNNHNQLKVIDSLCGDKIVKIKDELQNFINDKKEITSTLKMFGGNEGERAQRLDVLNYQISEIDRAEIKDGEFDSLKEKRELILNVEKILTALNYAKQLFDEDNSCKDLISLSLRQINSISRFGDNYEELSSRLENFYAEADDISCVLTDMIDELSFDAEEATNIEERLALLKSLFKKYGADEKSVLEFRDQAYEEYTKLENSEEAIRTLTNRLDCVNNNIFNLCQQLTKIRKDTAKLFCDKIVEELTSLNIPDASCVVNFDGYDINSANLNSVNGSDAVEFMFSANKGEPLKPLNKVISGGEMSRFMLALKSRLKDVNGISTYIFDEIDAGISGFTANTVAKKFIEISKATQIIAVSHLPQVCAASDNQYLIYKEESNGKTYSRVKMLSNDEKINELVRLTGNVSSDAAITHAKELINKVKII